jgi:hypothetical protein
MIGFIKPSPYMDYTEYLYGIITENISDSKYATGPILGKTNLDIANGRYGISSEIEVAKEALRKLGCDSYRFIPLRVYDVETKKL